MGKKSFAGKVTAFFTAAVMAVNASGCATAGLEENETGTQANIMEDGASVEQQEDYAADSGTGRYVEKTVFEGDYWDKVSARTLSGGQMMFVNSMTSQKYVSKDGGDTWEVESSDAFAAFIENHYPMSTAVSEDGTLAIITMDRKEGSENAGNTEYEYNLYIYNTDDTSKQITVNLPDADSRLSEAAFDEKGALYVYASGCSMIYKIDTDKGTAEKLTELQGYCHLMECRNNILMCMTSDKIFLYDMEKKKFVEDETLDSFIQENYKDMEWTGGGFTAYSFLGNDGTVYVAGNTGLYRHVIGGSVMEQVIDGSLSSLSAPSCDILAMAMNEKNEFVTVYNNGKIVKFIYDASAPAVPNDRITVYSLKDDDVVRQAIAVYQTEYPDMYIDYQIGMDEGGVTREDALKKLNTQLLGGSGPDVIMLDDINIQTYAEKGVLTDLSDVVNEINETDGIYMNLVQNMKYGDKVYAVPTRFCIPAIGGRRDMVAAVDDYQSFADVAEQARKEYPDTDILYLYSAKEVLKRFTPACAPSWKGSDGRLDKQKIKEFLEQSKRIYDIQMNGTPAEVIASHQQNVSDSDGTGTPFPNYAKYKRRVQTSDYLTKQSPLIHGELISNSCYREMMSLQKTEGFEDTSFKPFNGQSSNVYCPESVAGVNAAAKNPEAAKQFVGVMLSPAVLDVLEFGFPMNKKSMAEKFAYDESQLDENGGQYSESFMNKDGETFGFTIFPVEKNGVDNLEKWIAGLDTPYLGDTVLENAVYTEGAAYIEGKQDIDAAIKAIADSVEIYLYE